MDLITRFYADYRNFFFFNSEQEVRYVNVLVSSVYMLTASHQRHAWIPYFTDGTFLSSSIHSS